MTTLQAPDVMLCNSINTLPSNTDDYVMSLKLDGWRATAVVGTLKNVVLFTRSKKPITSVGYINRALRAFPKGTILDGEIVDLSLTEGSWNRTQTICASHTPHEVSDKSPALHFVVFDILAHGEEDVRDLPWEERQEILEEIIPKRGPLRLCPNLDVSQAYYDDVIGQGYEGVVVKLKSASYGIGRTGAWCKMKPIITDEAIVTGFTAGKGKFEGKVGAVCFRLENGISGQASGMNDKIRSDMTASPKDYIGGVVEIQHFGFSGDKSSLRSPQFKRVRLDRDSSEFPAAPIKTPVRSAPSKAAKSGPTGRMRNYKAMKDGKLLDCYRSLSSGSGDAYHRATTSGSGDPTSDLRAVEGLCRARGLV